MIGVCLPSRGLIYSKVVEGVFNGMQALEREGIKSRLYISHDLPIPDAHNDCVKRALEDGCERILFVEEDNYIGEKEFITLVTHKGDISALQYNDKNGSPHGIIHYNEALEILWCGLGATAINKKVFEEIGEPYFRTDTRYKITKKQTREDGKIVTEYEAIEPHQKWVVDHFETVQEPYQYGGLDVDFFTRARHAGYRIDKIEDMRSIHLKVVEMGEPYTNKGVHTITAV